jgi:hypothetical protein
MQRNLLSLTILSIIISLTCTSIFADTESTVFDTVDWNYEKTSRDISLYTQVNDETRINYYKAEIEIDNIDPAIILDTIGDFERYNQIFERTRFFKVVKRVDEERQIVEAELNFFPYRNRGYFIECWSKVEMNNNQKKCYQVAWKPVDRERFQGKASTGPWTKNIHFVNGRWTVIPRESGKTYIAVEYYNNWETSLPRAFLYQIEKLSTINNLRSLVNWCYKKQGDDDRVINTDYNEQLIKLLK